MFEVVYRNNSEVERTIHDLSVTAEETYAIGEALVLTSGTLTKCGATAKPQYIAQSATADSNGKLDVIPVLATTYFRTKSTATVAATLKGQAVTLHTDGLKCTATTVSGVFTIDETDGVTTTSTVVGHFA